MDIVELSKILNMLNYAIHISPNQILDEKFIKFIKFWYQIDFMWPLNRGWTIPELFLLLLWSENVSCVKENIITHFVSPSWKIVIFMLHFGIKVPNIHSGARQNSCKKALLLFLSWNSISTFSLPRKNAWKNNLAIFFTIDDA